MAQSGQNPLLHFLKHGAREGRSPSPGFDTDYYLRTYADVARSRINPLVHYILHGRKEGRHASADGAPRRKAAETVGVWETPTAEQLASLTIVVPVYNGVHHLERLLPALRRHTPEQVVIVLLDDCSPDARVETLLSEFAASRANTRHVRNERNLGFVRTVNRGARFADGHFILLNTDTVVPERWVERLSAPLFSNPSIASATPFSNAATIFSFPETAADNLLLQDCSPEDIDRAFAGIPQDEWPHELDAPTGVGFCMAVNGGLWKELGGFDEETFGKGYGEENDWCQRALAAGYLNVLVPNLFVFHNHGGSFAPEEKKRLMEENAATLAARWPDYIPSVMSHIERDPWHDLRVSAFATICHSREPYVIVDHALGGGANAYTKKFVLEASRQSRAIILLKYVPARGMYVAEYRYDSIVMSRESRDLASLVDITGITGEARLIYNNAVSWPNPLRMVDLLLEAKASSQAHLTVLIHDYFSVCPSYTLLDESDRYCGVPSSLGTCDHCLPRNPNASLVTGMALWRQAWGRLLEVADEIVCFSGSSRDILDRAYPGLARRLVVRPHEPVTMIARKPKVAESGPMVIGVIGLISVVKGARIVADLCRHLAVADPEARVVLVGEMDPSVERSFPNLVITGRYEAEDLPDLVERHGVNVCLLPSIVPETFSYVTQEIMAMELPLVCFDLGAPAERVRDYRFGLVVPRDGVETLAAALRQARRSHAEKLSPAPSASVAAAVDGHG